MRALARRARILRWRLLTVPRLRLSGIRLRIEAVPGAVLAGAAPRIRLSITGAGGATLTIRMAANARIEPGLDIELERGTESEISLGDSARIEPAVTIKLRGGHIDAADHAQIREHCLLKVTGDLVLGPRVILSYGDIVHAHESVRLEERVGIAERVTILDSSHEADGSDTHWNDRPIGPDPVVIGANTLVLTNSVVTRGARVGRNSLVGAGALVLRGEYPPSVLLAGTPAKVVRELGGERP